jgi:hypothetical protein
VAFVRRKTASVHTLRVAVGLGVSGWTGDSGVSVCVAIERESESDATLTHKHDTL